MGLENQLRLTQSWLLTLTDFVITLRAAAPDSTIVKTRCAWVNYCPKRGLLTRKSSSSALLARPSTALQWGEAAKWGSALTVFLRKVQVAGQLFLLGKGHVLIQLGEQATHLSCSAKSSACISGMHVNSRATQGSERTALALKAWVMPN